MASDCGVINGGTPSSPPPDTLNGGTPTVVGSDTVNGGQPLSPCPPFNDTSPAQYVGTLGDGGVGHSVIFHDRIGTPIIELSCRDVQSIKWTRELSALSSCDLTGGAATAPQALKDLRPLVHYMTVFRDGDFVWNGVLQAIDGDADEFNVTVRDYATFAWRTRTQSTRTWTGADPVQIGADIFQSVYEWHRLNSPAPARFPSAVAYDFSITKDQRRVDQALSDIVKLGMDWTIFRGRPVIIPTVRSSELVSPVGWSDCDFSEKLKVSRDGTRLYNDIMVKGKNYTATSVNEIADLRLQDIVALDSLSGASNIQKAADQLVARRSAVRLQVQVPGGATLTPDSPIPINDLMPGVIFPVHTSLAGGVSAERKLEKVEVTQDAGGERVQVTLGQVPLPPSANVDFQDL